jgi:hypothetical protein
MHFGCSVSRSRGGAAVAAENKKRRPDLSSDLRCD